MSFYFLIQECLLSMFIFAAMFSPGAGESVVCLAGSNRLYASSETHFVSRAKADDFVYIPVVSQAVSAQRLRFGWL